MMTYPFIKSWWGRAGEKDPFEVRIQKLRMVLDSAEYVVIGAGAGLSAAAGITYSGRRFTDNFKDFIDKYGLTDMYSAGFYNYPTEEEKWAYWARHIRMNRWDAPATELYRRLLKLVSGKEYFVITTNVDGQFEKAGFESDRVFAVQGDYGYLQCARGCHDGLYVNDELTRKLVQDTKDCRIPPELVPVCPVCGGKMEVHIRKDHHFVQNEKWMAAYKRYADFMSARKASKGLLLEIGVGYNTPTIIRFPFENLASRNRNITLARINKDYPETQMPVSSLISFKEDSGIVLESLDRNM